MIIPTLAMSSLITFHDSLIIWIWSSLGYTAAASSVLLSLNSALVPRPEIAQPIVYRERERREKNNICKACFESGGSEKKKNPQKSEVNGSCCRTKCAAAVMWFNECAVLWIPPPAGSRKKKKTHWQDARSTHRAAIEKKKAVQRATCCAAFRALNVEGCSGQLPVQLWAPA